jgi:hypothetical protein
VTDAPLESDQELVEVGRAHDRFEASIWTRQLEEQGISVASEKKGNWLRALLYLGRVPYAVKVQRKDHGAALAYLKKYRFL